ncbi:unnamed protein product [Symbiodinium sp. CCMP2592]|nr:unnamed protein product [Symbiodinium sp. CCMP2592]
MSSSSGTSSSSSSEAEADHASCDEEKSGQDETPFHQRVDNDARPADADNQLIAYMWTLSRADPAVSREQLLEAVLKAYEACRLTVTKASVFRERHPTSLSEIERHFHFHCIVETTVRARWRGLAAELRNNGFKMNCCSLGLGRGTYWSGVAYCFVPSSKKPLADLDTEYITTPGHPDFPPRLRKQRRPAKQKIEPLEFAKIVADQKLRSVEDVHAYAEAQRAAGWGLQERLQRLFNMFESWIQCQAPARRARRAMSHMQVLEAALEKPCTCDGRAIPGWEYVLTFNDLSVSDYRAATVKMLTEQGGKQGNHFYWGAPSCGKTALTRPLQALFEGYVMAKPQVGTTFPFMTLPGKQICIWNDFRWPHPPMAWNDLLNLADNEAFLVAMPKGGDLDADYLWNARGTESANEPTIFCTNGSVNHVETEAWNQRFQTWHFAKSMPADKQDRRFKQWGQCVHCYSRWLLGRGQKRPLPREESDGEGEILVSPNE